MSAYGRPPAQSHGHGAKRPEGHRSRPAVAAPPGLAALMGNRALMMRPSAAPKTAGPFAGNMLAGAWAPPGGVAFPGGKD